MLMMVKKLPWGEVSQRLTYPNEILLTCSSSTLHACVVGCQVPCPTETARYYPSALKYAGLT